MEPRLPLSMCPRLPSTGAALLLAWALSGSPAWSASTPAELEARVTALEAELRSLKAQLADLRVQPPAAAAEAGPAAATTAVPPAMASSTAEPVPALSWSGYGEFNYTRPTDDPAGARFDLARFVLGAGYRFDERTQLQAEVEIEHAVSSASDPGEVAIEQAYIERELGADLRARMGLFLVPSGLLNENHEPTRYYGVFRNAIETAIIPSTWREGGVAVQGNARSGLRWDAGLTTGFDLSRWDANSAEGIESPLGSIHQELALARAAQLSGFLAANYTGVIGLRVGASLFSGGAAQRQRGLPDSRVTLWEAHARWQPGAWDLAALYARGHISSTAAVNLDLVASAAPNAALALVPESFYGWYVEAAWRARTGRAWPLTPFVRYERFDTGARYAALALDPAPRALPERTAITGGLQMEFAPGVVLKADYVDFTGGDAGDRFDLGLGYEF
jgi:hypothetical protein